MTTVAVLSIAYAIACLGVIGFQFALIAGAPWGPITQGGTHPGALPRSGRLIAALSVGLLTFMACAILSAARLWPDWPVWTGWTALAVQAVSTLLNWISPSRPERMLWGPITTGLLLCSAAVVLS